MGEPLGRLVTVLVVSVAIAYLLLFYALARADRANQRVSRLVRALSVAQVEAAKVGAGWGGVLVCIPAYNEADSLPGRAGRGPDRGRRPEDPRPGHRRRLTRRDGAVATRPRARAS